MNKDVEEEECLVFYQLKECHEETAAQQAKGVYMVFVNSVAYFLVVGVYTPRQ